MPPLVLCTAMAVVDYIFRVERFPTPSTKSPMQEFFITGGGCAANAAIAVARLGGWARFAGPIGDDEHSARILDGLTHNRVDIAGVTRVAGASTSISCIFIDAAGERLLSTRRAQGLAGARPADPDALVQDVDVVLADNHFADFVLPICAAARARGLPLVLDVDKAVDPAHPLLALATHPIFSAEALRATSGVDDLATALTAKPLPPGFLAVTDGAAGAYWRSGRAAQQSVRHQPAFPVRAHDTLAAGDVFHAGFALALAEGCAEERALRFASAAAALKCTRFGGIIGTPARAEVEALLGAQSATDSGFAPES
jgi:sugar/nucleoside kinase (ribokinase family)